MLPLLNENIIFQGELAKSFLHYIAIKKNERRNAPDDATDDGLFAPFRINLGDVRTSMGNLEQKNFSKKSRLPPNCGIRLMGASCNAIIR